MQQRNPLFAALIIFVPFVGGLIWLFAWLLSTKNEMNQKFNTGIITGWILLVPFLGGLIFMWSYAGGAAKVHGKYSQGMGFLVLLLAPLGGYLHQSAFNEAGQRGGAAMQRAA
jgi:hypothetical protein